MQTRKRGATFGESWWWDRPKMSDWEETDFWVMVARRHIDPLLQGEEAREIRAATRKAD